MGVLDILHKVIVSSLIMGSVGGFGACLRASSMEARALFGMVARSQLVCSAAGAPQASPCVQLAVRSLASLDLPVAVCCAVLCSCRALRGDDARRRRCAAASPLDRSLRMRMDRRVCAAVSACPHKASGGKTLAAPPPPHPSQVSWRTARGASFHCGLRRCALKRRSVRRWRRRRQGLRRWRGARRLCGDLGPCL